MNSIRLGYFWFHYAWCFHCSGIVIEVVYCIAVACDLDFSFRVLLILTGGFLLWYCMKIINWECFI
jgi:hypothetical protein